MLSKVLSLPYDMKVIWVMRKKYFDGVIVINDGVIIHLSNMTNSVY